MLSLFSPFLHADLGHIIANSIPLFILGFLLQHTRYLIPTTVFIIIGEGVLVWLFARDGNHIGASGLVLGYCGFLLSYGYFSRSFRGMLLAVVTFLLYGGVTLSSLFNFSNGISFEGHIFGFLCGVFAAKLASKDHRAQ